MLCARILTAKVSIRSGTSREANVQRDIALQNNASEILKMRKRRERYVGRVTSECNALAIIKNIFLFFFFLDQFYQDVYKILDTQNFYRL